MIFIKCNHCDRMLEPDEPYFPFIIGFGDAPDKATGHVCAPCKETMIREFHLHVAGPKPSYARNREAKK